MTSDYPPTAPAEESKAPRYLILDTESVPDGKLVRLVKYPRETLTDAEAIGRAQGEAREKNGSDFLPVSFQIPVAVCVVRVGADFKLQSITCLGAPAFNPAEIVKKFWQGVGLYPEAELVTFNGRAFDMPLLELAAFRYGYAIKSYLQRSRHRFQSNHFDMMEWFTNHGAYRLAGGLDILSKILGKPGKMEIKGEQVYGMYLEGKKQEINDYCLFDTLDTYFVFLRTRVLTGQITLQQEQALVAEAKEWITAKREEFPALEKYLANWGNWEPWP
jgi:3'-5' exonuclease